MRIALAAIIVVVTSCGSFDDGSTTAANDAGAAGDTSTSSDAGADATSQPDAADAGDAGDASPPDYETIYFAGVDISAIALTEDKLYFADRGPGKLLIANHDGSGLQSVNVGGAPGGIALGASFLFVSFSGGEGGVSKRAFNGADLGLISTGVPVRTIATSGEKLAIVTSGANGASTMHVDGTGQSDIRTFSGFTNPYDVTFCGTIVWFAESSAGFVVSYDGSTEQKKIIGESDVRTIACASDGAVAWTRPADKMVQRLAASAAGTSTVSSNEDGPYSIAADGTTFYWLDNGGRVRRSVAGAAPVTFAQGPKPVFPHEYNSEIAFTTTHVYWAVDGAVFRKPKS